MTRAEKGGDKHMHAETYTTETVLQ